MKGFTFAFAIAVGVNLGYHHIKQDADTQKIVLLWEKYKYRCILLRNNTAISILSFESFDMSVLKSNLS
jgi:hypothetical protein